MPYDAGRLTGGTEIGPTGVRFRVWAPGRRRIAVVFESDIPALSLQAEGGGWFSASTERAGAGSLYRYRLDDEKPYADPYSRFQPEGPRGPSQIIDPGGYAWGDEGWPGIRIEGQVIYEMHIGAYTRDGTFDGAARELPQLRELGITCIEVLPVAEFPGRFNWGYDGVNLFAPFHGYGDHEAFKRFVDAAHALGLAVILDVVYNHVGPDGNYLSCFSESYFTDRHHNDWGKAINVDGEDSAPVRALFIDNAAYWMREFHLDGLRLDATQNIQDSSRPHVLAEICTAARAAAAPRTIIVVAENEPQRAELLEPLERGGLGLDAMWNDDFHHSARVALTGSRDGYFLDYRGRPQEFVSAAKHGFLFQGQHYSWQGQPRGSSAIGKPAHAFIAYIQNHDQVANTFYGIRIGQLASPGKLRAMTALLLLAPHTPMLFMGQEFGAVEPFPFFADHRDELRKAVREGRQEFMTQFKQYAPPAAQAALLDPGSLATFELAKPDFAQRSRHAAILALHRDLLRIRREDPVISKQSLARLDGAVLAEEAFVLRWFDPVAGDRLLLINLGADLPLSSAPEPLLAPPRDSVWSPSWASEEPVYGGSGAIDPFDPRAWCASRSATLFESVIP